VEEEIFTGRVSRFDTFAGFLRRQFHQGRGGRAKLAITTSLLSRVVTVAISLVVLPISVRYLGNEGYGLMVTITSVVGWLQFTNMGIGLGLQNALTEETAKGNSRGQRELISTAVFSLVGIGLVVLVAGLLVFPHISWERIFPPTSNRFVAAIPWTVLVVFIGFVSTVVLGFISPIYAARQELHIGAWQSMVASVLTLAGTFVAVRFRWGLLGLTLCTIGITAVAQWTFAAWNLFGRGISDLRPRLGSISRSAAHRIYKTGISFFVLQTCNIAFFQIDAFLIARFLTIDQVTPYSVAQKVFIQMAGLFAIITGSLWAAYGNAKAVGDFDWIRRTHRRMTGLFFLFFGGLALFMLFIGHYLLAWWVGVAAAPSTLLIGAVGLYFIAREWTSLHAMLLNGLDVIRPQVWNLVLTALLTVGLDLWLVTKLGSIGLAVGGFVGFTLAGGWYLPYLTAKALRYKPINNGGSERVMPA
jgi:O-antigen/teichoic acid export membrane protein